MNNRRHFQFALLNLALLSVIGFILRYKIVFSLPWIDQKHLLHAHSHFAFSGWIAQAVMVMIIHVSGIGSSGVKSKIVRLLLNTNLFAAYGMLISFSIQGYGTISSTFSTLSILVLAAFGYIYFKDSHQTFRRSHIGELMSSGVIYGLLSSVGAFALGMLMMTKTADERFYLLALYFFLHFQYNGFFILTCIGLFLFILEKTEITLPRIKILSRLMILSVIPSYFLSVLWAPLPMILYLTVVAAALVQALVIGYIIFTVYRQRKFIAQRFSPFNKAVILLATAAFIIKLILQLGSTIPALSTWAYGYRPIVIGYLHLVLLGVITLSLLAIAIHWQWIRIHVITKTGMIVFISGLILNELGLLIQGLSAIAQFDASYAGYLLLFAAFLMMIGLITLWVGNRNETSVVHSTIK